MIRYVIINKFNRHIKSDLLVQQKFSIKMNKTSTLQRQIRQITNQNQILRSKTKKIHEIQSYVNILIQNNQSHQQNINALNYENIHLKNQVQILVNQRNNIQSDSQRQIKKLKFNYDNEFQKMTNQIRGLLNEKQKHQMFHQRQKQQIILRTNNQIQKARLQIDHINRQHQVVTKKMADTITRQLQELEIGQRQIIRIKKVHISDMNQQQNEKNYILNLKNNLTNENILLNQQINKQSKLLHEFSKIKSQLIRQLQISETQKSEQKENYQRQIKNINQKLNQTQIIKNNLQAYIAQLQRDIKKVYEENKTKNMEIEKLQSKCNQTDKGLKEIQHQMKNLVLKYQNQKQDFTRLQKRYNQQILRCKEQNQIIQGKLKTQKLANETKTIQIQDLIRVVDKLQINLAAFQDKIRKLLNQNAELNQDINKFTTLLQENNFQNKILNQKVLKSQQKIVFLEQQKNKNTVRMMHLQGQHQKHIKQLNKNYRQISEQKQMIAKKLKNEIDVQNQRILNQKREMIQNQRLEKQQIVREYENALKIKDQQFKKRLNLLQEQIMVMRVRH